MTTIGAENLVKQYGSPLGVAEALLKGHINAWDQEFVSEVVNKVLIEAAKIRIEWAMPNVETPPVDRRLVGLLADLRATKRIFERSPLEITNDSRSRDLSTAGTAINRAIATLAQVMGE